MFKFKKAISFVLVLVLALGVLPVAYAADEVEPVEAEVVHDHDHDEGACPMSSSSERCPVCGVLLYTNLYMYDRSEYGHPTICYYAVEETKYSCPQHGYLYSKYAEVPAGHRYRDGVCINKQHRD